MQKPLAVLRFACHNNSSNNAPESSMKYHEFTVTIVCNGALKFIDVVAVDASGATADVKCCYGEDVDIVSIRVQ